MNITDLKTLAQRFVATIPELNAYTWVTTDNELSRRISGFKQADFPLLVVVTPSFDPEGKDPDSVQEVAHMIFFVLKNGKFQSEKESIQEADMNETLSIIRLIKDYLLNGLPSVDQCILPNSIVPHSFHIDPEFNYLGCNGWSISFQLKTL